MRNMEFHLKCLLKLRDLADNEPIRIVYSNAMVIQLSRCSYLPNPVKRLLLLLEP